VTRIRGIPLTVTINVLAVASAGFVALLIVPPDVAAPYTGLMQKFAFATCGLALAIWLPVPLFLGGSVAALAVSSGVSPVNFSSMQLYTYDMLLFLVLFRAVLPRARRENRLLILTPAVAIPAAFWVLVMLVAGIRGLLAENHLGAIARLEIPLVYFPLFCWGFTRILSERSVSVPRVIKTVALVAVAFIAYAAYARITHQRFGPPSGAGLGVVPTTTGTLRRDYGFFSAFQVYPLLALGAFAYLFFSRRARVSTMLLAGAGVAATFLTFVRGLIFGLVVGAIWLAALSLKRHWHTKLASRLLPLVGILAAAWIVLLAFSPAAARGVAERSLPGILGQSQIATGSADYRANVLATAGEIAWNHPLGLGFQTRDDLKDAGYPPVFVPHTQWGTLLVYTGWPGLLALSWLLLALVQRSRQLPAAAPWLHPMIAATCLLVVVQGFAWDVLFSQTWSLGLLALVVALRLGLGAGSAPDPARTGMRS
jgi:hypothetical protein